MIIMMRSDDDDEDSISFQIYGCPPEERCAAPLYLLSRATCRAAAEFGNHDTAFILVVSARSSQLLIGMGGSD